jgi:transportin-1
LCKIAALKSSESLALYFAGDLEFSPFESSCAITLPPTASNALVALLLQALFDQATDVDPAVRKEVCKGLVGLMNVQPDLLLPHMEQLIQYMLVCNQDQHEDVALEAAEFWMAFIDAEVDPQMLKPIFQQLVPVLLKNMVCWRGRGTWLQDD